MKITGVILFWVAIFVSSPLNAIALDNIEERPNDDLVQTVIYDQGMVVDSENGWTGYSGTWCSGWAFSDTNEADRYEYSSTGLYHLATWYHHTTAWNCGSKYHRVKTTYFLRNTLNGQPPASPCNDNAPYLWTQVAVIDEHHGTHDDHEGWDALWSQNYGQADKCMKTSGSTKATSEQNMDYYILLDYTP